MKNRKLNIFDAGIAFVIAFILAQFTSAIGVTITQVIMEICGKSATQISTFWDTAFGYLLQAIYMNVAFVLVFIYYYKKRDHQSILQQPTQHTKKYVGICILIGIATMFLLSGVLNYFQLLVDKLGFTSTSLSYELNSPKNYLISLVSLALIPAICEELIFRGVITSALKQKGQIFAIVLSSIMFAMFHFSPSQLIYPICFGLILAIVYLRTNNIIFPILLHFINNALSLSIQYFSSDTTSVFTHSISNLIYAIITFAIWIWIICYLFNDFKKHNLNNPSSNTSVTNDNQYNQSSDILTNQTSDSTTQYNVKTNNMVLYGSIAIMGFIYILLLFV